MGYDDGRLIDDEIHFFTVNRIDTHYRRFELRIHRWEAMLSTNQPTCSFLRMSHICDVDRAILEIHKESSS